MILTRTRLGFSIPRSYAMMEKTFDIGRIPDTMMKKGLLFMLFAALFLVGCTPAPVSPNAQTDPSATMEVSTPVPTPEPSKVIAIVADSPCDAFYRATQKALEELGYITVSCDPSLGFSSLSNVKDTIGGVVALRLLKETTWDALSTAQVAGARIAIIDMHGVDPLNGAAYAHYQSEDISKLTLDTAIAYPPHDTPVRMFALFAAKDSPANRIYEQYIQEGRIFDRGMCYAPGDAQEFMEQKLDQFVEGLVDCVYVETLELAREVLLVLEQHGRTDMEVFCLPSGDLSEQQALYARWVFPVALGVDFAREGTVQAQALHGMLQNAEAPATHVFGVAAVEVMP